jgi:hypothetical protein
LVNELFVNDVPELMEGGKYRLVLITAAARLVGSYNDLVRDFKNPDGRTCDHAVVVMIRTAAEKAEIDDPGVNMMFRTNRWLHTLKVWSTKIKRHFLDNNQQMAAKDDSVAHQLATFGGVLHRTHNAVLSLSDQMNNLGKGEAVTEALVDDSQYKDRLISELERKNKNLESEVRRLKRQVAASMPSPTDSPSPKRRRAVMGSITAGVMERNGNGDSPRGSLGGDFDAEAAVPKAVSRDGDTGSVGQETQHMELEQPSPSDSNNATINKSDNKKKEASKKKESSKKKKEAKFKSGGAAPAKVSVAGLDVKSEMERLWKDKILYNRNQQSMTKECGGDPVSKEILFNDDHYLYVGINPDMKLASESARCMKAMKLVAMGIGNDDWKHMINRDVDNLESRRLFERISNSTKDKASALEIQTGLRNSGKKSKALPTLHSLGDRYTKIYKKWKELGMSESEIKSIIERAMSNTSVQSHIGDFTGNKA